MKKELNEEIISVDLSNKSDLYKVVSLAESKKDPVIVSLKNDLNYSYGVVLPRNHPSSMSYLKEVNDYNDSSKDIYEQIRLCEKLYKWEGIISTVIDLHAELSYSPIKIDNIKNDKAKKLVKFFLKNVNVNNNNISDGIDAISREAALSFYLKGNVFPYIKWSNFFVDELNSKYRLPMNISLLDPKIIEIDEDSAKFGNKKFRITFERLFGKHRNLTETRDSLLSGLPVKIRNKFKTGNYIELDNNLVYHIKRKGFSHSGWGTPYLTRAFSAIASKRRLRALDDSTIDGLINSIILFKVGDPKREETLTKERIRAFANLIKNPTAAMTIVCSYDVQVDQIKPDGELLKFADRYKVVDADIAHALGVPSSIIDGQGERSGDIWVSLQLWIERLEEFKYEFQSFINKIIKQILNENGFKNEEPVVSFVRPKISKDTLRTVVLAYYDRGLLSKETTLREGGFDRDSEVKNREIEKSSGVDDVLITPNLPYSSPDKQESPGPKDSKTPSKKRSNVRKDTKKELDTKPKKISPNIEGNSRDKVLSLFSFLGLDEDKFEKSYLINKCSNFIETVNAIGEEHVLDKFNLSIGEIRGLISHISTKPSSSKEEVLKDIDEYFLSKEIK